MESAWLVFVALAVGLVAGASIASVVVIAARTGSRAAAVAARAVPSGVEAVLDVLDAPAVLVDPSNVVVRTSASAARSGLVEDAAHGHGVVVDPQIAMIASDVRSSGEPVHRELVLGRPGRGDGTRHLRVHAALVGARYVLVVGEDRTETVRLDEVRRDFVANVSHELKTPIGAVSLLAEAIETAADDPQQVRKFASRLAKEGGRLATLTQDIIELSRVQGAEPLAQSELVEVDAVIAHAIDQNRVVADAKGIVIASGGTKGLAVFGHEVTLVTAVHNLIANAVQYSPEHSRVGVGVTQRGETVEIAVTDQGPGISEEEQARIFERFFRSDPARSRNTGGSGLGLAIVKHAIQNHGGEVRVWSQAGRGSTFMIRLPLAKGGRKRKELVRSGEAAGER